MSLYDRIKALCDEHKIAVTKLESELGFARGSIGKLRNQKGTSSERIEAIANYFGVTADYLMTGRKYYLNEETEAVAQELFEEPGLRLLFDAARGSDPEALKLAADMLRRMKGEK